MSEKTKTMLDKATNNVLSEKQQKKKKMMLNGLYKYFYEHQYAKDHFMACDECIEYDFEGNRYVGYNFYA